MSLHQSRLLRLLVLPVVLLLLVLGASPAQAAARQYRATFTPGVTDGLSKVSGSLRVYQNASNQTTLLGRVAGLQPYGLYVAVPYTDGNCTPLPGITAFPSGSFFTDSTGAARVWVTVNPKSINPAGSFTASQTKSVSIRRVVLQGQPLPGLPTLPVPLPGAVTIPTGTPTVPNVVAVEACDKNPKPINK